MIKKYLLIGLLVVLLAIPCTSTALPRGGASLPTTCPQGTSYPNDGCLSAQSTGSIQHSNFFIGYTSATYTARPPWNVAAVDYAIGYAGALSDPTGGGLPGCASLSGSGSGPYSVAISGSCTVSHFDFSLYNGICVTSSGSGPVTLSNNKFGWGTNCNPGGGHLLTINNSSGSVTISYNEFDGSLSGSDNLGNLIGGSSSAATTTVNVYYNAFLNTDQADVQPGAPGTTWNILYNYAENIGVSPNHGDFTIPNNSTGTLIVNDSYNTVYAHTGNATTLCYITASNSTATVAGTCDHETLVGNPGGSVTVSYLVEVSDGTLGNWTVTNNYMDANGAFGFFVTLTGWTLVGTMTCSGNINMNTGGAATGTLAGTSC